MTFVTMAWSMTLTGLHNPRVMQITPSSPYAIKCDACNTHVFQV